MASEQQVKISEAMAETLLKPYTLSEEQLASFDRDGFLILRDLLDEPTTKEIQQWSQNVHDWPYEPGKWMPYEEQREDGTRVLCRTENFADFHDGFDKLFRGQRLLGILEQINKEPMVLFKEKINYKHPGAGGFDAHTDAPAYQHAGALKHLTINLAIDAATPENGCLEVSLEVTRWACLSVMTTASNTSGNPSKSGCLFLSSRATLLSSGRSLRTAVARTSRTTAVPLFTRLSTRIRIVETVTRHTISSAARSGHRRLSACKVRTTHTVQSSMASGRRCGARRTSAAFKPSVLDKRVLREEPFFLVFYNRARTRIKDSLLQQTWMTSQIHRRRFPVWCLGIDQFLKEEFVQRGDQSLPKS